MLFSVVICSLRSHNCRGVEHFTGTAKLQPNINRISTELQIHKDICFLNINITVL